jgi:hypothetical protein
MPCPRDSTPWCVQPLSTTTDVYKRLIDRTAPVFNGLLFTMIGTQDRRTRSVSNDVEQQTRLA